MDTLEPNHASAQGAPDQLQRRPIVAFALRRIAQRVDATTFGPHRGRDGAIIARRIHHAVQNIGGGVLESWAMRSADVEQMAEIMADQAFQIERRVATLEIPDDCNPRSFRRGYRDSLRERWASGALAAMFRAARPPRSRVSIASTVPRRMSVARAPRRVRTAVAARVAAPTTGADGPPPPRRPLPRCRVPIGGAL